MWDPDGVDATIEITSPKNMEYQLTKDISQIEAEQRIGYLAKIVDTQGWSIRGTGSRTPNNSMITDAYYSAQQVEDIMDEDSATVRALNQKLQMSEAKHHKDALGIMTGKSPVPQTIFQPQVQSNSTDYFGNPITPVQAQNIQEDASIVSQLDYDPYPEDMRQTVISPVSEKPKPQPESQPEQKQTPPIEKPEPSTSEKPLTADIINLANNPDLSIETIAREAKRIHKRQDSSEEVFVSLR
jgi:hypothetical protein